MTEYDQSVRKRAETKVRRIIAREGTDNDVRLQPWYIESIEEEIKRQDAVCAHTINKMQVWELASMKL